MKKGEVNIDLTWLGCIFIIFVMALLSNFDKLVAAIGRYLDGI